MRMRMDIDPEILVGESAKYTNKDEWSEKDFQKTKNNLDLQTFNKEKRIQPKEGGGAKDSAQVEI